MKSAVVILSTVAALASAGSPLMSPGTGQCVVTGDQNMDGSYTLTLGSCDQAVAFSQSGGNMVTDIDGYCMCTLGKTGKVGLTDCSKGSRRGKMWAPVAGTDQWKCGQKKCLDYDADADCLVYTKYAHA